MNSIAKRVLVGVLGGLITLVGVVALVAPGPGWLIIFTGLGILASEFAWAARLLRQAKNVANQAADAVKIKKRHRLMIVAALTFASLVLMVFWYASTR
ncbi:TIGR02611 family protein [Candidatus Nanopelagicus hibericus]|jgi:uncharacterized protein (TIGR02611 family)|uniref:TIGR02611 family protein n=1 Tax=Candidatus Nanopelagicus hibericus TaxID=1884915 RepID=A0A249K907_9ACTN|nr:PGPGW domain-containing protein [Candidatus Nanopelagicus hibericus]ASY13271.1 TIGR02611 family protein [Candidatus Nanopelagicus hibericus]